MVRTRIAHRQQVPPNESPFAVYFADTRDAAYQLEQWIPALQQLRAAGSPVTLLITNSNSANRLLKVGDLPIFLCPQAVDVENFVREHNVQVLFYVNNNQANFTPLRINKLTHVHLSHGESEKSSMVSNQLKAYDFAFIAGPVARERILAHIRRFDASALVEIGRPQLDFHSPAGQSSNDLTEVLYAPTWEGDSPAMAYSSLAGSGRKLIRLLASDDRIRLTFRPHPKTGTRSHVYADALRQIRRLLGAGVKVKPFRGRSRPATDAISDISRADVVITDVSAMAMDSVGLNKPTLVLTTSATAATGSTNRLLSAVPAWSDVPADAVQRIIELAREGVEQQQRCFRQRLFGTDEGGTGTERFIRASQALLTFPPSNLAGMP
ncbi:CDP-glycerol glycerophosphotransferase family protein [Arthrobacter rhombi]|uniref:CDP-glycerol glycerophosphotransferase family protein n=1 Tax=Arthrobacter rhombi TaxID=71253 RepID=UPI003FD3046B